MRLFFKILNSVVGLLLFLLLITMIDKKEYAEVIIDSPVFFSDAILVLCVSVGPVIIGWILLKELRTAFVPILFFALAILSCVFAYYNLPAIREERLLDRTLEVERALDNLRDSKEDFRNHQEYYQHLIDELKMFYNIYHSQYEYLARSGRVTDMRANRVPMFFGLLAVLFLVNSVWLFLKPKSLT